MPWSSALSELSRKRTGIMPWAWAVALFAASLGLRILLARWLDPLKFLTFYPAIAAATLLCGWPQGILVLFLATVSAWYLFFEPANSFALKDANTVAALVGFLIGGGFIVLLVAALRETVNRLETARRLQEDLFRELQHRVANNLQVVVAMLHYAKRKLHDSPAEADQAITEAEARIWAMAQLNRRLYDGTASAEGLGPLLSDALKHVFQGLPVNTHLEVAQENLSINQMTALTLLVTEAATNAAKHVFRKGRGSLFEVRLAKEADGHLKLTIRDDGPGLNSPCAPSSHTPPLGVSIMQAFAHQLGGSLHVNGEAGTTISVQFAAH